MSKQLYKNICDKSRFEAFFKKHAKSLHSFLYYKFGDRLNPEDKTQEAFIKLWENCKKVSPDKAKSYVFTIANNLMLNEVAHQKVVLKHQQTKTTQQTNLSPEFLMEEDEYRQKLEQAIANLTEAQRVAFLMNRVEGKRFKEIATLLDISTKAVEKRIYGALKKLRQDIDGL
ncbi:RNA polymerase sigma factor [Olleya marilimosa]|uniref:Sigma-70 family RNA polymerase sigma factor n=1 Tax=Olleya marilimosa TaxID=272164 RepID=A0ABR8LY08_9FLAO|nr:sigma-70 family RNA polymerase sigma factor [Olleya marilimosa]MBD3864526.1 sigma-70 family RNA polymerase sigma factor [Olleya marilimosa]MBD3892006.1 sigma-70 family RNA polymerase sigma factor [Olleya marilimosa]